MTQFNYRKEKKRCPPYNDSSIFISGRVENKTESEGIEKVPSRLEVEFKFFLKAETRLGWGKV